MSDQARRVGIASLIWASSIFLSRVIGLLREMVIGRVLGASRAADVYWTAFVVPDFLNYLLAAGALSIVFIPIFSKHLAQERKDLAWSAFSVIANFLLLLVGAGVIALSVWAEPICAMIAPGFSPSEVALLTHLTRIILPAQIFHVVGGLLSAVLQAQDRHALAALGPLLYSAGIIAGGLIGGPEGFAWGVLAGSLIGPFGLPLLGCLRGELRWRPVLDLRHPDLWSYLGRSLPIMVGFSIVVVDEWILKNQASLLGAGVISHLQYARTLMKVPMGVFGMAAGVAAFPTLSRMVGLGHYAEAYSLLCRAVRLLLIAALGAQVCLTVAGYEAVYLIWGQFASRFTPEDARATAEAMAYLCLGLGGWAAQTVIARGFYAMGSTWLPTLVGTSVAVGLAPLYWYGRWAGGAIGLAVASSVAILLYVFLLGWLQRRRFERVSGQAMERGLLATALKLGLATSIACGIGLAARRGLTLLLPPQDTLLLILLRATLLCGLGLLAYLGLLRALRVQELNQLLERLGGAIKTRLRKNRR